MERDVLQFGILDSKVHSNLELSSLENLGQVAGAMKSWLLAGKSSLVFCWCLFGYNSSIAFPDSYRDIAPVLARWYMPQLDWTVSIYLPVLISAIVSSATTFAKVGLLPWSLTSFSVSDFLDHQNTFLTKLWWGRLCTKLNRKIRYSTPNSMIFSRQ